MCRKTILDLYKTKIPAFEVRVFKNIIIISSPKACTLLLKYNNERSIGGKKDFRKQLNLRCLLFHFRAPSFSLSFDKPRQETKIINAL